MIFRLFIECGCDNFRLMYTALHLSNLFGSLIHQQNNDSGFRIVDADRIGNIAQYGGFPRFWLCDDKSPLPFPDRSKQIDHTGCVLRRLIFKTKTLFRVDGHKFLEITTVVHIGGDTSVNPFYTKQGKITLTHFGWTDDPNYGISLAKSKSLNLRWRDIDVVGAGFVVIVHRAKKTVPVG